MNQMTASQAQISPRIVETIHALAAALWLGMLGATGVAAAIAFPAMKVLQPNVAGYTVPADEQWRIVAGHLARPMFAACDNVGIGCCALCGITLSILRPARPARIVVFVASTALLLAQILIVSRRMSASLDEYWTMARGGDSSRAAAAQAAFDRLHPLASGVLVAMFVAVACILATQTWSLAARTPGRLAETVQ
jgi:hypothetical protein